jgi:hypothetical protein
MSTLVASYLARSRGSKEPELSLVRVRDLEQFIRELRAFQLDHGYVETDEWDGPIDRFRRQLEEILDGLVFPSPDHNIYFDFTWKS